MSDATKPIFEVVCPCCAARLSIDPSLGVVLHYEPPPKAASVEDLQEAVKALKAEASQREARFKEQLEKEKVKGKVLERKFQELLKKAKEEPAAPPPRPLDLD